MSRLYKADLDLDPVLQKKQTLDLFKKWNLTILVKNSFLTNSSVLIANMKIVFSNSYQPKNIQIRLFRSQIWIFLFHMSFCILTNLRVLISNITIVFSAFSPKNLKWDILDPKFEVILFCTYFKILTNSRELISNMAIMFSNFSPRHFWSQFFFLANSYILNNSNFNKV